MRVAFRVYARVLSSDRVWLVAPEVSWPGGARSGGGGGATDGVGRASEDGSVFPRIHYPTETA